MDDGVPNRRDATSIERKRRKDLVRTERQTRAWLRRRGPGPAHDHTRRKSRKNARQSGPSVGRAARKALHSRFRHRLAQFAESEAFTVAGTPQKGDPGAEEPMTPGGPPAEPEGSPTPGDVRRYAPRRGSSPRAGRGIDAFLDAIARANAASGSARRGMEDRVARSVFTGLFGGGARAAAAAAAADPTGAAGFMDADQAAMTPAFEQACVDVLRGALFGAGGSGALGPGGERDAAADLFRPWEDYVHADTLRSLLEGMPAEGAVGVSPRAAVLRAAYARFPGLRTPLVRALAESVVAFAAMGAAKCAEADEEPEPSPHGAAAAATPLRAATAAPQLRLAPWLDLCYSLVPRLAAEGRDAARRDAARRRACEVEEEDDEEAAGGEYDAFRCSMDEEDEEEEDEVEESALAGVERRAALYARCVAAVARAPAVCTAMCARATAVAVALARACPGAALAGAVHPALVKWPRCDGAHEAALFALLAEVLATLPLPALPQAAPRTHALLLRRIQHAAQSPNAAVARRALELCARSEMVVPLVARAPGALQALTAAVHAASKSHWDPDTRAAADAAFDNLLDLAGD